jgi:hypothetical protein
MLNSGTIVLNICDLDISGTLSSQKRGRPGGRPLR